MTPRLLHFLAIILVGLALVPAGAHLFALPNKIAMSQEDYFTAQAVYRGWALFGIVLIAALVATVACAFVLGRRQRPYVLAGLAGLLIAATLAIFFLWTFPANQATANWTVVPENWRELRMQWEFAHAVNAVLTFAAFCAITLSALRDR